MSNRGQKLIKIIRDLAAEKPDFVYERPSLGAFGNGCVYVHAGQPSCIVGHAMWRAGLIDHSFEAMADNRHGFGSHITGMKTLTDREVQWLEEVQGQQDTGAAWSDAVLNADNMEYDDE